jgi:hypothetical protein
MPDAMSQGSPIPSSEAHEFDFLEGEWDAVCRFPQADGTWGQGPGTLKASKVLDGCACVKFFEGPYARRTDQGPRASRLQPQIALLGATWTDTSSPGGGFQVWRGRFIGGKIDLLGEWDDDSGQRILSRLTWSEITGSSAHWESHRSLDGEPPGQGTG